MERRKPSRGSIDELALVKAAAWAWYEHGSGSEGRVMREYDLAMPNRGAPKPSRYKLEAMKESQETPLKLTPPLSPSSPATNSETSLLDDYEIEWISKQLDLYIEPASRAELLRSVLGGDHCAPNKVASFSESGTTEVKSKPKNKVPRGFWLKYGAICGSWRESDVDGQIFKVAYLRGGSRKRV